MAVKESVDNEGVKGTHKSHIETDEARDKGQRLHRLIRPRTLEYETAEVLDSNKDV